MAIDTNSRDNLLLAVGLLFVFHPWITDQFKEHSFLGIVEPVIEKNMAMSIYSG